MTDFAVKPILICDTQPVAIEGVRGLLEPERGDDALWDRARADRIRGRLSDTGAVVAHRVHHFAGASGDLAARRFSLVEGDRVVVT